MGKSQKYTEDLLLEGVIKYSEFYKKKIKATELAKWCSENVAGLEEARDYHFTRNIKECDDKTGKMRIRKKLCAQRIEEINKSRSLRVSVNSNLILRSSNIDVIFEQPQSVQRKLILESRDMFEGLMTKNYQLERENEALKSESSKQKTLLEEVDTKVSDMQKSLKRVTKQVNYLMKEIDLENRKKMLEKMGIKDETIDLNAYTENLQQSLDEVMNIRKTLLESYKYDTVHDNESSNCDQQSEVTSNNYVKDIISGIDFD